MADAGPDVDPSGLLELAERHLGRRTATTRLTERLEGWRFEPIPGRSVLLGHASGRLTDVVAGDAGLGPDKAAALEHGLVAAHESAGPDRWLARRLGGLEFDGLLRLPPLLFHPEARAALPNLSWLVFAFEEEAEYAARHGPEALLHLLEAQRLDPLDLGRNPANTLVSPEDAARLSGAVDASGRSSRRGYKVEQQRGEVRIQRRRSALGRSGSEVAGRAAPEVSPRSGAEARDRRPSSDPAPRPVTRREPPRGPHAGRAPSRAGSTRAPGGRKRFELDAPPPDPAQPEPPSPRRRKAEATEDPAEAKARRVAELKKTATEARVRAKARARGEAPQPPTSPTPAVPSKPEPNRAVRAAARRRGRQGPPR